jgi:hypothetical protein
MSDKLLEAAESMARKLSAYSPVDFDGDFTVAATLLRDLAHNVEVLTNALWKACGDDREAVEATIESQGKLRTGDSHD